MAGNFRKIKKVFIGDRVYRELKQMIFDKRIAPGSKIDKAQLCEKLQVSPTPVNEAIKRLIGEDLIEKRGKEGFFTREYTAQYLLDYYEARAAMESMALRHCVESRDEKKIDHLLQFESKLESAYSTKSSSDFQIVDREFHRTVLLESGNLLFEKFIQTFNLITTSFHMGFIRTTDETIQEHRDIFAAIRSGNEVEAQNRMLEHHIKSRDALADHLKQNEVEVGLLFDFPSESAE